MLTPLRLAPGVFSSGTKYQAKGAWRDANLMRFLEGTIRPVGGWSALARSGVVSANAAVDTFSDSGGPDIALTAHVPDSGITAWEYGGVSNTWQVEVSAMQQRTYRANASGGFGAIARSTNNLAVTDGVQIVANIMRAGVDGSGEVGLLAFNNGSHAKTVVDGLLLTFQRLDAATVTPRLYTFKNDVKFDDFTFANVAWASLTTETKTVTLTYAHPTVTINVGGTVFTAVIAQDMRANGQRFGFYSDQYGSGGWRFLDVAITAQTPILISGVVRSLLGWRQEGVNSPQLAIGTNAGVYTFTAGALANRTPGGLTAGAINTTFGTGGFGDGAFGAGAFGVGDQAQTAEIEAGVWRFDTFGNYLLGVLAPSDGVVWVWDGVTATMRTITQYVADHAGDAFPPVITAGAAGANDHLPTQCTGIVVTPERFMFVLGAHGNPRLVQWPSRETLGEFQVTSVSTAGGFVLPGVGRIICGKRGRNETLIFTEDDLYAAQFIGGTLLYSFVQLGTKCGVISPNVVSVVDGRAAWMGRKGFWIYDGYVQPAPTTVSDAVFSDFNETQRAKCFAVPFADLGEVHFYYCSAGSDEPDRYVIWNYRENHWTPGRVSRTAGIDRGAFPYPVLAHLDTTLYEHERGTAHAGAAAPFLESGPIEIGDGDTVTDILGVVPDEATRAGQVLGSSQLYLYLALYPTATETQVGPYTMANPTSVRQCARQVRVRVEEVVPGDWRLGVMRLDVQPGSQR